MFLSKFFFFFFFFFFWFLGNFFVHPLFFPLYLLILQSAYTQDFTSRLSVLSSDQGVFCGEVKSENRILSRNHFCHVKNHCPSSRFAGGFCSSSLHFVFISRCTILIFRQYVVLAVNEFLRQTGSSLPRVSSFVSVFSVFFSSKPFSCFHLNF